MDVEVSRIGLLGLLFDLYLKDGNELLLSQERFAADLRSRLMTQGEVVYPGACTNRADVEKAFETFRREKVDLVVIVFLTYTPSLYVFPAIKQAHLPVVLFNTQRLAGVGEGFSFTDALENHGVHGVQDLANVLLRSEIPFRVVSGYYKDEAVLAEIAGWCQAARIRRFLAHSQLGLIGYPMENMGDFGVDYTTLQSVFGVHVNHLPMRLVAERVQEAPQDEIEAQMQEDRERFLTDPEVTKEAHQAASRLAWALRNLCMERSLIGFASHFAAIGDEMILETLPFLAASKLLAEGIGFGGEGDVCSALAVSILRQFSGMANFTEMFCINFEGGNVLMSHMGEGNWRMAHPDYPVRMVSEPFGFAPLKHNPVSLVFNFKPEPVTLLSITKAAHGRYRFVVSEGEVVDEPPLKALNKIHFKFKPQKDLPDFLTAYSEAGGSHHQGMAFGRWQEPVRKLAALLDVEYVVI